MKIITTLIGIMGFQYMALCQATATSEQSLNTSACYITYSEDVEAIIPGEASALKCREITIMSLPPLTQSLTMVHIEFGMTGSFTFKKDPALELNDSKDIYIEDMLTGKLFNLKTSDSYTFNVNRRLPNRFVLHIDKMLDRYAVSLR